MRVLLSKSKLLSRAFEDFERCTQDREIRELALALKRFQLDQCSNLKTAKREGHAYAPHS